MHLDAVPVVRMSPQEHDCLRRQFKQTPMVFPPALSQDADFCLQDVTSMNPQQIQQLITNGAIRLDAAAQAN